MTLRSELRDESAGLRTELKGDLGQLRSELTSETADLRGQMGELRTEIVQGRFEASRNLRLMVTAQLGTFGLLFSLIATKL